MNPLPPDDDDAVVRWGKLVGRTLGWAFMLLLFVNLFTRWFF